MTRWRGWLIAAIALGLAPATWLRSPAMPPNNAQALSIVPIDPGVTRLGPFRIGGVWQLTSPNDAFGSYSALVSPAPGRLLAFSDRGDLLGFAMPGQAGAAVRIGPMPGKSAQSKHYRDFEAASLDPVSGRIVLALEGRNAFVRHGRDLALEAARWVPEMAPWSDNAGPEALARLGDGRYAVLCECRAGWPDKGLHPALLFAGDPAQRTPSVAFTYAGSVGFRPTDMAPLPDGRMLILERRLLWPMPPRFSARVLLADPRTIRPGGTWRASVLADLAAPLPVDNMEALTVTQGSGGQLYIWLMSDDNQALTQRTLLYRLDLAPEDLPSPRMPGGVIAFPEKQKAPGTPDASR